MPQRQQIAASLRNGRMIEAETETAEIPIKKTAQVVLPMGSTSNRPFYFLGVNHFCGIEALEWKRNACGV